MGYAIGTVHKEMSFIVSVLKVMPELVSEEYDFAFLPLVTFGLYILRSVSGDYYWCFHVL